MDRIRWERSTNPNGVVLQGYVGDRFAFVLRNDRSQDPRNWRLLFQWVIERELRGIGVMSEDEAKKTAERVLEHWLRAAGLIADDEPTPFDVAVLEAVEDALSRQTGHSEKDAPPVTLAVLHVVHDRAIYAMEQARSEDSTGIEQLDKLVDTLADAIAKISGS
jgi:hypothetical protein